MDIDIPDQEEQDRRKQLVLTQGFAAQRDPDSAAKVYGLAKSTGAGFEELEKAGPPPPPPSWEALVRDAPVLAERLSDPGRAAAIHDDVETLTALEKLFRGGSKIPTAIKTGWKRGNAVRKLVAPAWADLTRQATPEQLKEIEELRKEIEASPEEKLGYLSGVVPAVAEMAPLSAQTLARSVPYAAGGAVVGAGVGAAGGSVAGGVGAAPGAVAGAGTGAVAGWRAGTFVESGRAEAALAWDEFRQIPGVDLEAARGAAFAVGLVNGALEVVGLESIFKAVPALKKIAGKGARGALRKVLADGTKRQVLLNLAKHVGAGTITEGVTEALQELSTVVGGEAASGKAFSDALGAAWRQSDRVIEAGVKGAQGGGGMSVVVGAIPLPAQLAAVRKAKERQALFTELGGLAAESKTLIRLPAEFQAYVDGLREKYGSIDEVRVPAEKLNELFQREGWDDREVAERMPSVARQLGEALQNPGVEVSVSISDLTTHLAPLPSFTELTLDLRVGEEPTAREAPVIEERAKKLLEEVKAAEEKASPRPVFDDVRKQLVESGISDNAASKYAAWWDAFVTTRASRLGVDPAEYYHGIGLTVSNEDFVSDVTSEDSGVVLTPEQVALKEQALSGDTKAAEALLDQLMVDELTGANNANSWLRFKAMNQAGVYLSIDANDLKRINDTLGHDKGNEFLKKVAETIGKPIREQRGKFFRAGGDEFAAHFRSSAEAEAAVKGFTEALNALPALFGEHKASISVGSGTTFQAADLAAAEAKKAARAAGRSGFGRPGAVEVQDLSKGDVFYSAAEVQKAEELFQIDEEGVDRPGPAKWTSAAVKAVRSAKQEKGDTKSWLSVVSKGVKKEELESIGIHGWFATVDALRGRALNELTDAERMALFPNPEEAKAAANSTEKFRGVLSRDQVLKFVESQALDLTEEWLGTYQRQPSAKEMAEYEHDLKQWEAEHASWESEVERRRDEGLSDADRVDLLNQLSDRGVHATRLEDGSYQFTYETTRLVESSDFNAIMGSLRESGDLSRSRIERIADIYHEIRDRIIDPGEYFVPEYGFNYKELAGLPTEEREEKLSQIQEELGELEDRLHQHAAEHSEQLMLIPRTEDEVIAQSESIDQIEYEKQRLEYQRKLITGEILPEPDFPAIRDLLDELHSAADDRITVEVVGENVTVTGSVSEEYTLTDSEEIVNSIRETDGPRSAREVDAIMSKLSAGEAVLPPEPERPQPPGTVVEESAMYSKYVEDTEAVMPGTYRELLLYAPGESGGSKKTKIKWQAPHFGDAGVGLLAHARVVEHSVGGQRSMFIEEVQSDRFQRARDYVSKTKRELQKTREAFSRRKERGELNEMMRGAYERETERLEGLAATGGFESQKAIAARLVVSGDAGTSRNVRVVDPLTGSTSTITTDETDTDASVRERASKMLLREYLQGDTGRVLDAPFKGDAWVELTLKRLLMYAVDRGHERIQWTPGDMQADRWSGAVQERVSEVKWRRKEIDGEPMLSLRFFDRYGDLIGRGNVSSSEEDDYNYSYDRARNTIGSEMFSKIQRSEHPAGSISGTDIWVGGEGFRLFYDQKIPAVMERLTKQKAKLVDHPGMLADTKRTTPGTKRYRLAGDVPNTLATILDHLNTTRDDLLSEISKKPWMDLSDRLDAQDVRDSMHRREKSITGAIEALESLDPLTAREEDLSNTIQKLVTPTIDVDGQITEDDLKEFKALFRVDISDLYTQVGDTYKKVWEIDLPKELRDRISSEGMNLFQREKSAGAGGYRGKISFDDTRTWFEITLTGRANLSTFIHESGHAFLEVLVRDALSGHKQSRKDLDIVYSWLGADSLALTEDQKEKWARAVEAYVRGGKPPSSKLAEVFRAFKGWLMMIYSSLRGLDVELTEEITGVMDRLFATDVEIEQAKQELSVLPTITPEDMEPSEYAAYVERVGKATAEAREAFEREALREWRRGVGAEAKLVKRQVEERVKQSRAYNAYEALHSGARLDGAEIPIPGKLSRERLNEYALGPAAMRRLRAVSTAEGGVDPETVAPFYGYGSGLELAKELAGLQPRTSFVKEETHRRLAEKYPGFDGSKEWFAEGAVKHLHSNEVNGVLWSEYVAVSRLTGARPDPSGKAVLSRAAKRRAESMGRIEMQPGIWERAEAVAAREWAEAYRKKDYQAAADALRRRLLNHYTYKAVLAAREEADSAREYLSKFEEMRVRRRVGRAGADYLNAIDALLEGVELRKVSNRDLRRRENLAAYLERMEAAGEAVSVPQELRDASSLRNWKHMPLAELRAVVDAVKNIEHMARTKNRIFDGVESRDFTKTTVKLSEHIRANVGEDLIPDRPGTKQNPGWWDQKKAWLRSAHMSLTKIEFLCRVLDGGSTAGFAHKLIFEPFVRAQNEKMRLTREVTHELTKPFEQLPISERLRYDREVDFLGYRLRLREVLAVALNLGNEGNKRRLLEGYSHRAGWTEEAVLRRIGELLTDKDLDLVEHIWKVIGSLKDRIGEVHKRVIGLEPEWVEAAPVEIDMGDRKRTLTGGYYPIVKDRLRSQIAEDIAQRKTGEVWENSFMAPVTESGFTKSRGRDMSPLLLSLEVVPAHLNEVIHYVTHYEAVRAVDRLTRNRSVEAAVKNGLGVEAYQLFRPWLQAIAMDGNIHEGQDFIDKVLRRLRLGSSVALLGFKVSTGLKQWFGLAGTAKEIGPKWTAVGVKLFMQKLTEGKPFAEAAEHSTEIKDIDFTHDRDIGQAFDRVMSSFSEFGHLKKRFTQVALGWIMLNQKMVNAITWYGAKEKALAEGHPDPERFANSVVRMAQSGGGIKDLAAIQRGTETKRLFVTLYTYFSVMFNQLGEKMPAGKSRTEKVAIFAARWLWLVTLPVFFEILTSGKGPDDGDEPEDWLLYATKEQLLYAGRTVPFAGSALEAALSDRERRYGAWFDTLLKGATAAGKAARKGGEVTDSQVRAMVDLLGAYYGLPSGAVRNAYRYTDEFSRMDEPVMNLLFRPPSDFD